VYLYGTSYASALKGIPEGRRLSPSAEGRNTFDSSRNVREAIVLREANVYIEVNVQLKAGTGHFAMRNPLRGVSSPFRKREIQRDLSVNFK
jgi:hypothetical protein